MARRSPLQLFRGPKLEIASFLNNNNKMGGDYAAWNNVRVPWAGTQPGTATATLLFKTFSAVMIATINRRLRAIGGTALMEKKSTCRNDGLTQGEPRTPLVRRRSITREGCPTLSNSRSLPL